MDDKEAETFITILYTVKNTVKNEIKNNKSKISSLFEKYKQKTLDGKITLIVASSSLLDKLFVVFLHYYNEYLINKKIDYVSIDLEFNAGAMALMQLNFGKYIWIINPQNYQGLKMKKGGGAIPGTLKTVDRSHPHAESFFPMTGNPRLPWHYAETRYRRN